MDFDLSWTLLGLPLAGAGLAYLVGQWRKDLAGVAATLAAALIATA